MACPRCKLGEPFFPKPFLDRLAKKMRVKYNIEKLQLYKNAVMGMITELQKMRKDNNEDEQLSDREITACLELLDPDNFLI